MGSDGSIAATAGPVMLECRDLRKSFGGVPVLKGVSLALEPGTVTALAGENGADKLTMMKIASGRLKADHGEVLVRGEHLPTGDPKVAHRLGVAIVPREPASIDDMTVYENLFGAAGGPVRRHARLAGDLRRTPTWARATSSTRSRSWSSAEP